MTGTEVVALIVVCATVISGISIFCYMVAYICTNDTLIRYIHDLLKGRNENE